MGDGETTPREMVRGSEGLESFDSSSFHIGFTKIASDWFSNYLIPNPASSNLQGEGNRSVKSHKHRRDVLGDVTT